MKISGTTIVRNAIQYGYPAIEAIKAVLPICDEFVVNVGKSDDNTLELIKSINDPKIRIVERVWDMSIGQDGLSVETNFAVSQCTGDWVIYAQTDELIHEDDLWQAKNYMECYLNDPHVDAFQLKWLHFYGSYYRYRIDAGWFQKQIRIIRNNGTCESHDGAWGFRRRDGKPINTIKTPFFIYHYGWVQDAQIMAGRRLNAHQLGFAGTYEFEAMEFNSNLNEIKALLFKIGEDLNAFSDVKAAVVGLNKTIKPFQTYATYIKTNAINENTSALMPANFASMTDTDLDHLALTTPGRRFKRAILTELYPDETPKMHFGELSDKEKKSEYDYGDLNRFPIYFGKHPKVMDHIVLNHAPSQKDWQEIKHKHWWNPLLWFRIRYKTGRRQKTHIG